MTLALRTYQNQIVNYILGNRRCNLFVPMGMGKTVSTLTALDLLALTEDIYPVLVLAPLRVAQSTWPDEVAKWPHLRHLTVSVVTGDATARRVALSRPADIYTMNYENLTWLDEAVDWTFKTVVADECSKLKGFRLRQGGKRARALAKHVHSKVSRYIGLTGTPSSNGLQDLWGITWMVDRGQRLGTGYNAFINRWFRTTQVGADRHAVKITPLPYAQREIEDNLRDVCMSLDMRDHFDIAEPIVNVIRVELPAKARQQYKEMEKEMFLSLSCGSEVEALNAASKTVKCLQLANGAIYTDDKRINFSEVHDVKLQALESVIEEAAGMPVLVAYHFKSDLVRLQKAFPKGRALDSNPDTIRDWNHGEIPILFAHPASAGHGLNLQDGGNIIAFFGHWWNLEEHMQIIERIGPTRQAQAGHKRPVFIHHIVAAGTVDELVMARRDTKRDVQDLLMEAMKQC